MGVNTVSDIFTAIGVWLDELFYQASTHALRRGHPVTPPWRVWSKMQRDGRKAPLRPVTLVPGSPEHRAAFPTTYPRVVTDEEAREMRRALARLDHRA